MIHAALMLICFVENTPLQGSDRQVILSDAYRFGVGFHQARALWRLSEKHKSLMRDEVQWNNSPKAFAQWECEVQWRARCWYLLDDAVNCPELGIVRKLQSLNELRCLIGDEAFYAGIMPAPIPRYRIGER